MFRQRGPRGPHAEAYRRRHPTLDAGLRQLLTERAAVHAPPRGRAQLHLAAARSRLCPCQNHGELEASCLTRLSIRIPFVEW